MTANLLFSVALLFIGSYAIAQEAESDFTQPGRSESVVEEYGPVHDAFQDSKENPDTEFGDVAADAKGDFSRTVPEPYVPKSRISGAAPPVHRASAKTKSRHIAKSHKHPSQRIAKKHMKKNRAVASVGKIKKHGKTHGKIVAKRKTNSYLR